MALAQRYGRTLNVPVRKRRRSFDMDRWNHCARKMPSLWRSDAKNAWSDDPPLSLHSYRAETLAVNSRGLGIGHEFRLPDMMTQVNVFATNSETFLPARICFARRSRERSVLSPMRKRGLVGIKIRLSCDVSFTPTADIVEEQRRYEIIRYVIDELSLTTAQHEVVDDNFFLNFVSVKKRTVRIDGAIEKI